MLTAGLPVLLAALFLAYRLFPVTVDAVVVVFPRRFEPAVVVVALLATVVVLLFSANLNAVFLAIFLIFWSRSLKHPSKLTFLDIYLIFLLFR